MPHPKANAHPRTPPWRAVLFDLDGTLLDTLEDIANSVNWALEGLGFPIHPVDAYRHFVGDGVDRLFSRALPHGGQDQEVIAQCIERFREGYLRNWDVHTRPYDGVESLLEALAAARVKMAVLSNKPDEFTQKCVQRYLPRVPFDMVIGQRDGVPRKPDPAGATEIAQVLAVPAEKFLYLGDMAVDMETACRAGMRAIGAAWGFRRGQRLKENGATAVIERPTHLLDFLGLTDTEPPGPDFLPT